MLLRTRLAIVLSLAFVVVVGALVLAGLRRETLMEERFAGFAIAGQLSLWNQLVDDEGERLLRLGQELAAEPDLDAAAGERRALRSALTAATAPLAAAGIDLIQAVDASGALLFSSLPSADERPVLDAASLDLILQEGASVMGIRQDSPDRYLVLAALPLKSDGRPIAAVTLAIDAETVLRRFTAAFGAPSYLVSLRGRLVRGTDAAVWESAGAPPVPPRSESFSVAEAGDRLYSVTGVPVPDFAGGVAGTLVTLRDSTASFADMRALARGALIAVGGFVLLLLTGLYLYLKRSFRPLEGAISVLRALSQGDTNVRLEETGQGEISRIAQAVTVFRQNAVLLDEHRQQQERLRRRQERLIRRQMETLAETLESEGRAAIMEDLQAIVQRRIERLPAGTFDAAGAPQDDQLGQLALLLQRMSARISDQHHRLTELVVELREAIITRAKLAGLQQELEIARQLQLSILPKSFPRRSDVELHGLMVPAKEVGGDFYDFFLLDESRVGIVVADVSGKGVPAALFMAITRTLLKATTLFSDSPAACLTRLNRFLAAENDQMMFVTLVYGILDLASGRLTYVNAGHNPPLLLRGDGTVAPFAGAGNMALAVLEEAKYHELTLQLAPGDALVFYTDGVTEAFDPDGEAFGDARLQRLLAGLPHGLDPPRIAERLLATVHGFERGAAQADDITCVVLRFLGRTA